MFAPRGTLSSSSRRCSRLAPTTRFHPPSLPTLHPIPWSPTPAPTMAHRPPHPLPDRRPPLTSISLTFRAKPSPIVQDFAQMAHPAESRAKHTKLPRTTLGLCFIYSEYVFVYRICAHPSPFRRAKPSKCAQSRGLIASSIYIYCSPTHRIRDLCSSHIHSSLVSYIIYIQRISLRASFMYGTRWRRNRNLLRQMWPFWCLSIFEARHPPILLHLLINVASIYVHHEYISQLWAHKDARPLPRHIASFQATDDVHPQFDISSSALSLCICILV